MPVRKFRSLEEAARSLWLEPGDPRIWDGVIRRWQVHRFVAGHRTPARAPGVYKFRSVHEKQRRRS
jgi:hypothetical protein